MVMAGIEQAGQTKRDDDALRLLRANGRLHARRAKLADEPHEARPMSETLAKLRLIPSGSDPFGLIEKAGIPRRHCRITEEHERHAEWKAARDRLLGRSGTGYLVALLGPRGVGKTQMAVHAALRAIETQRSALYIRAMDFFLRLRATYRGDAETELSVHETLRKPSLLIIDEIQTRAETAFEDRQLTHLIDLRYGDMSDTILICNLNPKAFADSLDPSIIDRLRETGGILECAWSSFREAKSRDMLSDGPEPVTH